MAVVSGSRLKAPCNFSPPFCIRALRDICPPPNPKPPQRALLHRAGGMLGHAVFLPCLVRSCPLPCIYIYIYILYIYIFFIYLFIILYIYNHKSPKKRKHQGCKRRLPEHGRRSRPNLPQISGESRIMVEEPRLAAGRLGGALKYHDHLFCFCCDLSFFFWGGGYPTSGAKVMQCKSGATSF